MKTQILFIGAMICLLFAGCEYDNYDKPNAIISGKVVYEGKPVGVRTTGTQLELWQDGFQLHTKIPVHISQDGSFSAAVFKGSYKIVRLAGAPWEAQPTDTIRVEVRGNTVVDVPVTPYFVINNESFERSAGKITAKFTVEKIVQSANVHSVSLFLGDNILTDFNYNKEAAGIKPEDLTLGSPVEITADIPVELLQRDYVFARIGVRSSLSGEYYYTQVQKVNIK